MVEDPDEGQEEAKAALRAAKRARGNGSLSNAAMLNAMEAAEKQHESKSAQGKASDHSATSTSSIIILRQGFSTNSRAFAC